MKFSMNPNNLRGLQIEWFHRGEKERVEWREVIPPETEPPATEPEETTVETIPETTQETAAQTTAETAVQ